MQTCSRLRCCHVTDTFLVPKEEENRKGESADLQTDRSRKKVFFSVVLREEEKGRKEKKEAERPIARVQQGQIGQENILPNIQDNVLCFL